MIQDLHSHTYYSFCGHDRPEEVVEAAIAGGIELLGITDHNYGIGFGRYDACVASDEVIKNEYGERMLKRYFDHINLVKEKYADKITLLRGIEIATATTAGRIWLPENDDVSFFDYAIIEHFDFGDDKSIAKGDLFAFRERLGCPVVGVAHTDMFGFFEKNKLDAYAYFKKMAENNIFWEMNVNLDSTHGYREHKYMLDFFEDTEKQQIVRESGVRLSVGFDGHLVKDYKPERVKEYCKKITNMGIKLAFE